MVIQSPVIRVCDHGESMTIEPASISAATRSDTLASRTLKRPIAEPTNHPSATSTTMNRNVGTYATTIAATRTLAARICV